MVSCNRVSIPIEKHYGFIQTESGIVVDHFGPVSIIQLDNGDRTVIIDDNFYQVLKMYLFNNQPVTNYHYDGDHWVDFDTDAGHYHIPVLAWINAKYTGLVKEV